MIDTQRIIKNVVKVISKAFLVLDHCSYKYAVLASEYVKLSLMTSLYDNISINKLFLYIGILTRRITVAVQQFGVLRIQAERKDSPVRRQKDMRDIRPYRSRLRQHTVSVCRIRFKTFDQSM